MRSKSPQHADKAQVFKPQAQATFSIQAQFQQAVSFHQHGDGLKAAALYDSVIKAQPGHADAWHLLGLLATQTGAHAQAVQWMSQAIELNPHNPAYYNNRGLAYQSQGMWVESLQDFQQAVALQPNLAQAHCNLGNVLQQLQQHQQALSSFDQAIALQPEYADAHFNRANLQVLLQQPHQAVLGFDQALAMAPGDADVLYNKATALLLGGMYENGWPLHEARWERASSRHLCRSLNAPLWLGKSSIQGKKILLHAEQGLGDTMQFIRYVPMVAALGATVIVEVQAPLMSLFQHMPGISVLIQKGDELPPFDVHCPLMSLPLAFNTSLSTVPAVAQFQIPDDKKMYWANRLGKKVKPRVGLVWSGGVHTSHTETRRVFERRNLPLQQLTALAGINVDFISLQKGEPAESEFRQAVAAGWDGPAIRDYVEELKDFSDTAALVINLDLVIAVDTSTAHLAASLGKPVWLLNRFDTCWRWMLERQDSPWYPSLKIYRQPGWGDWGSVMQRVTTDLQVISNQSSD